MVNDYLQLGYNSIIITAPVMIPYVPDCDEDIGEMLLSPEQIREFKESFESYNIIDAHHNINNISAVKKSNIVGNVIDSFILDEEQKYKRIDNTEYTYPAGTWMLTTEIFDKEIINELLDGKIMGYSPSVFSEDMANKIAISMKSSYGGLIKNLKNPKVVAVSLVRNPCQSENKICKIRSDKKMTDNNAQSKVDKIKEILNIQTTEKPVMKSDMDKLKEEIDTALKSQYSETKEFIIETVNNAVKEALTEISLKEDKEDIKDDKDDDCNESNVKNNESDPKPEEDSDDDDPSLKSDENNVINKSDKKGLTIHETNHTPALKSDRAIILDLMGRDMTGRLKKQ